MKEDRDRENNINMSGGRGENYDDDMRDHEEILDQAHSLGHSQGQGQGQGQGVGKNSGNHYYGKVLLACTDSVHAHDAIAILEKVSQSVNKIKYCDRW